MTNEVLKALEERRSVRGYTAEMPSQELLDSPGQRGVQLTRRESLAQKMGDRR